MSTTSHIARRGAGCLAAVAIAVAALATAAPAEAAYGWPLQPVQKQHPVRGFFGDPRIEGHDDAHGAFHFGIDISAADGTAVYAAADGVVSIHPARPNVVTVLTGVGAGHEYWHVIAAVRQGARAIAGRTVVGHVEAPWGHVHFSEVRGGVYVNPLRPGALSPYRDTTPPTIHAISFERDGVASGNRLSGRADIVVEAWDRTPLAVPAPWAGKPVTPALVKWCLIGRRRLAGSPCRVAADFTGERPRQPFASVYARFTRQNHPWRRGGRGRYRFLLARRLDTRALADGTYRVAVTVRDTAGNEARAEREFTVANSV
jgi:hypothetical protein